MLPALLKLFSYWYLRSTSLKVVFLQQFIYLTAKLRTAWFTSFLSGPPVYDVLQGIPISTHPPGVEKSSFNTICGSGSWWSTPPSFNPHPPFYLFIWFSLLWAKHHGPWHNSKDCRESNQRFHSSQSSLCIHGLSNLLWYGWLPEQAVWIRELQELLLVCYFYRSCSIC